MHGLMESSGDKVTEISEMEPKDAERQIDITTLDTKMTPVVVRVHELQDEVYPRLQSRVEELKRRISQIDPQKPNVKKLMAVDHDQELLKAELEDQFGRSTQDLRNAEEIADISN